MKKHRFNQKDLKHGKWKGPAKEASVPNSQKRPVHKANLKSSAAQVELDRKHPEPLSIFNRREQSGEVPKFPYPKNTATLGEIEKAAVAMRDWDNSDPFAYGRTVLYVRQGFLRSDEVVKEMGQRTLARRVARAREVDNANVK